MFERGHLSTFTVTIDSGKSQRRVLKWWVVLGKEYDFT